AELDGGGEARRRGAVPRERGADDRSAGGGGRPRLWRGGGRRRRPRRDGRRGRGAGGPPAGSGCRRRAGRDRAGVRRAQERAAGKPVLALKLGRGDRARSIIQSHTGAIADQSWVYEVAFRERGIVAARDIDELLDSAQLFAQLPRDRHRTVRRIGMVTTSGG